MALRAFEIDVHYDGSFMYEPFRYADGIVLTFRVAKLDYNELVEYLVTQTGNQMLAMYYCLPEKTVSDGLVRLSNDSDVDVMFDVAYCYGKLAIYMEHYGEDISRYLAVLGDEEENNDQNNGQNNEGAEELVVDDYVVTQDNDEWIMNEVLNAHVNDEPTLNETEGRQPSVDEMEREVPTMNETVNEGSNVDESSDDEDYEMEGDLESDSDSSDAASIDHLSEGEDELREYRTRKANAKKEPKVAPQPQLGVKGRRKLGNEDAFDTIAEHEDFMEELLKKLKMGEEEMVDPFKQVETVERYPIHDKNLHWRLKKPVVGERFENAQQFKDCLTYYALANGFSIWYERSSQKDIIARCGQRPPRLKDPNKGKQRKQNRYPSVSRYDGPKCPFRCFARSMMPKENSFLVCSLTESHTCVRNFKFGSLINYKWIGKQFGAKIRFNPEIKLVDIAELVMKKYKCIVTSNQCRMAKDWALNEYEKSIEEHYGMLRSYADAILETNPGLTVKIDVTRNPDEKVYFDRFYVCFDGLKKGWKNGCRRIIALDGCFLKSPNTGELLTAIGRDGNNHIFPIAWAVVNVENKYNWSWFIELLSEDLDIQGGVGVTLMSDQHKVSHLYHGYHLTHLYVL